MKNKLLILLLFLLAPPTFAQFEDQENIPSWATEAIEAVKNANIMKGFGDGSFRPKQDLTRAEAVTLLLRSKQESETEYNGVSPFPDVHPGLWFNKAVGVAAANGWIEGRPDGKFYPGDNLTRAEFSTLIMRAFDLEPGVIGDLPFQDIAAAQWYSGAVSALYQRDLLRNKRNRFFRPEHLVSRAEAAWTFAQIMNKPGVNGQAAETNHNNGLRFDNRRVAIKPKDFNPNQQGYEIERKAIHVDANPQENVEEMNIHSGWTSLGTVRFKNTFEYGADVEHISLSLRFDGSGMGPNYTFDTKIIGPNLEKEIPINRAGDALFTALNHRLAPQEELVLRVMIQPRKMKVSIINEPRERSI